MKDFFRTLKKLYKYDHFDKRDGSIISSLKEGENEELVTDPDEVNKRLMLTIKDLQFDATKPQPRNLDFPMLKPKSVDEMKEILCKISSGKAIAWDALTDSIFRKTWMEKSALLFADLWQHLKLIKNLHFESRLIPLNKVHPQIPTRKDMRPIIVTSPLVKLIEAGIMPDLRDYLIKNLHHSQTGFVPGFGIFVNIHRALSRIKLRTLNKQRCYGIFVDFSSAYNTIDHQILFSKLAPIIGEEKTQLIRALYSRLKIRLGKEVVLPNQGVAQGSLISPALFDIYAEGCLYAIQNELGIDEEDLLAYADDTLIICDSLSQVSSIIEVIRLWSGQNNMKLNEKKSGIVEFVGRRMRRSLRYESICGFPVCGEYKYLGVKLTSKLTMGSQLDYIKYKARDIQRRLSPFLHKADVDTKKNLWQVFVRPLIEFVLPLYKWETSKSIIQKADSIFRCTFKLFLGLNRSTENSLVDTLSGFDFRLRAQETYELYTKKWEYRRQGKILNYSDVPGSVRRTLSPKNLTCANICLLSLFST